MLSEFNNEPGNVLKQAFMAWVVAHYNRRSLDEATLPAELHVLSECSAWMPADPCERLLLPHGSTYASGVAALLAEAAFVAMIRNVGHGRELNPTHFAVGYRRTFVPDDIAAELNYPTGTAVTFAMAAVCASSDDRAGQVEQYP